MRCGIATVGKTRRSNDDTSEACDKKRRASEAERSRNATHQMAHTSRLLTRTTAVGSRLCCLAPMERKDGENDKAEYVLAVAGKWEMAPYIESFFWYSLIIYSVFLFLVSSLFFLFLFSSHSLPLPFHVPRSYLLVAEGRSYPSTLAAVMRAQGASILHAHGGLQSKGECA